MKKNISLSLIFLMLFNFVYAQNLFPNIETRKITDKLYEFYIYINNNNSVNIFAYIGSDGVLMIDGGYGVSSDLVKKELCKITEKKIKYLINTHHNVDHTGANQEIVGEGVIIAHNACRSILLQNKQYNQRGLPNITFQDSLTIFFDGEEVQLKYFPGHTSSDIVVFFKNLNLALTGDLVFLNMFPLIQTDGSLVELENSISNLRAYLNSGTRIFPSHGGEVNLNYLQTYSDMIQETKSIVLKSIQEGLLPDKAIGDDILKEWRLFDSKIISSLNADRWISKLYNVLEEGKEMSAFFVLKREYTNYGMNSMICLYKKITNDASCKHYFSELDFNRWGYELVNQQKINDAIEVFKINATIFPKSANVYDSLGEVYSMVGDKKQAIQNYRKSLEINPQNKNAIDQIKILTVE